MDIKQSNQVALCLCEAITSEARHIFREKLVRNSWPSLTCLETPPVLGDPISTLKHNLKYPKHQWKLENSDALRYHQGNKMCAMGKWFPNTCFTLLMPRRTAAQWLTLSYLIYFHDSPARRAHYQAHSFFLWLFSPGIFFFLMSLYKKPRQPKSQVKFTFGMETWTIPALITLSS